MTNPYDIDGPYTSKPFANLDRPWIRAIAATLAAAWITGLLLWLAA